MTKFEYTIHGDQRANQRGFRRNDVELIRKYGTIVQDRQSEVYWLSAKDTEREIKERKQEIQCLERLRNCKVVFNGNRLKTVHHTSHRNQKRLLRRTV